jgi:hypothetical protein
MKLRRAFGCSWTVCWWCRYPVFELVVHIVKANEDGGKMCCWHLQ